MMPADATSLQALAVAGVQFALSAAVTAHVLLRKRDVGAAVGWIGLAWLTPFVGSALYLLLGINRVHRRAQRLSEAWPLHDDAAPVPAARETHGGDLAALERAGHRITRRPTLPGNGIALLHGGDEAYEPMLAAIEEARASIGLSSYILSGDAVGRRFIEALIRAQGRGVAVRVLLDGIGSGYFWSPAFRRLRRGGVPAARFMHSPLPWRMPFLNLRTHKKILVADGRRGFTGGLNIARENLLAAAPRHPVRDSHFAVEGPVVAQLAEAFTRDWLYATGETLAGEAWFPALAPRGEAVARVVTSGPDQDLEKIEFLILQAIACARRSIRVMTPYFLPDERLVTALALAPMRGIEVDVILPERGNHVLVDWAMRAHVGPLIAAGCRLWRNPPPFDHSKLMVVDDAWCLVGSANWDVRSFRLNFELNMEVFDTALARQVAATIEAKRGARVHAADLAARSLPARLRDAGVRLLLPYL